MILKILVIVLLSILDHLGMCLWDSFAQTGHKFQFNNILRYTLFLLQIREFGYRHEELHALEGHLGFALLGS